MKLSLDEISNWLSFEDLCHAYFESEKDLNRKDIRDIKVEKSGTGPDDGFDLIITIIVTDGIESFERKWVVQCKFYEEDISPAHLNKDNIPGLIHSYGATGYLLICKKNPTAKMTRFFKELNNNCRFKYCYKIWTGEQFCRFIETQNNSVILKRFFPEYHKFISSSI